MCRYVTEILTAISEHEPVSPWDLHHHCPAWSEADGPASLRAALRAVMQVGWAGMDEHGMLAMRVDIPVDSTDGGCASSQDGADQGVASAHPTQVRDFPPTLQLVPTGQTTTEIHPGVQTESQTRALCYAIQSGVASLSRLEDALSMYLQDAGRLGDGKVHRAVCDLLRRASIVRQEFSESQQWLQESQPVRTSE
jgi:hypothetical protein